MKKPWIITLAFLFIFLVGRIVSIQAAPYSLLVDEFGPGGIIEIWGFRWTHGRFGTGNYAMTLPGQGSKA